MLQDTSGQTQGNLKIKQPSVKVPLALLLVAQGLSQAQGTYTISVWDRSSEDLLGKCSVAFAVAPAEAVLGFPVCGVPIALFSYWWAFFVTESGIPGWPVM